MLSDRNGMKIEISSKKDYRNNTDIERLNDILFE